MEIASYRARPLGAAAKSKSDPIDIMREADFPSNDQGIVLIEGLRYSDFADGRLSRVISPGAVIGDSAQGSAWSIDASSTRGAVLHADSLINALTKPHYCVSHHPPRRA